MRFQNKTAFITGAAIGIGMATAEQFAKGGANIVITDINEEGLMKHAEHLRQTYNVQVFARASDVSDEGAVHSLVTEALSRFGKIDILVNNAALWRRQMRFCDTTSDMWKEYIGINILGTMYCTHEVLPQMVKNGWGRVINIASVAGVYGNQNMVDYSMTKGAIISFTRALAKEVATDGVTVNSISPGSVSNHQDVVEPSELSFMGRTGTHTENAELICYLASNEAAYISGQNIQIDGCRKKQ